MINHRSQTLVEALVAIGLTVTALVSIISLATSYLRMGGQTIERVLANNLAREGLEIVRSIRDSQWLDPTKTWPYGLSNGDWIADYDDTSLTAAESSNIMSCDNCRLWITSNNQYTHTEGSNTLTIFRRLINISNGDDLGTVCNNDCEKQIRVTVAWTDQSGTHTITLEERLTSWR